MERIQSERTQRGKEQIKEKDQEMTDQKSVRIWRNWTADRSRMVFSK